MNEAIERPTAVDKEARLLLLLSAAKRAGLGPVTGPAIHSLAYLSNVLSPIWDLPSQEERMLKTRGGPYYPGLQRDLDRLVGRGLVRIFAPDYTTAGARQVSFGGKYDLLVDRAGKILDHETSFRRQEAIYDLCVEICLALSKSPASEIVSTASQDLNYSLPDLEFEQAIEYGSDGTNLAILLSKEFDSSESTGRQLVSSEYIHIYLDFIRQEAHGAA